MSVSFEEVNLPFCNPEDLDRANGVGTPIEECFTGSLHQPVSFPDLEPGQSLVCDIDAGEYGQEKISVSSLDELVMCFNAFKYLSAIISWHIEHE